ncbi:MAG: nucleoside kinase [Bacilli bacterium]|nr:nucleoside kinase [Bacilli bacterium]
MSFKIICNGQEATYEKKISIRELIGDGDPERKYVAAKVNGRVRELEYEVYYDAEVEYLTCSDSDAVRIYEASLRFVTAMAFKKCYPNLPIRFSYNISRAVSIHLLDPAIRADNAMLLRIRHEMERIINADLPLKRMIVPNEEAAKIYEERGYLDKLDILQYRPEKTVHLYQCEDYLDYMYSRMVPSTGYLRNYKLRLYAPGFILQYPRAENGGQIPPFEDAPTFGRVLRESHDWSKIVGASTVSGINKTIKELGTIEFINLSEARHNRMLCELGQLIQDDINSIRLICIAGPSSSGKTTFANRLRIELLSRGIRPIRISLDDYYKERKYCPLDEDGKLDFESIEALDIEQFNQHMLALINGEEVQLPKFDFELGHQVPDRLLRLDPDQPIIIEGIHALNDRMTTDIPKSAKFKIFIAPQQQLNLDDHTPVSLTDLRLLRRIVRDHQFRGSSVEETLSMWPSVRRGEFRWIYPTQEGCDFVYNSMLPYELPVMKKYAEPLLRAVEKDSPYFLAAERLERMLKFFIDMDDQWVPSNSLMREFIGGSCYKDV